MKKKSFNDDKSPNYLLLSCKRVLLLFYLLFSTLVSAQIYIIGDTKIFISESTTISAPISQVKEHTSEKAKIYITKGTVIKSLEQQSSNIQIAYIPSHFPQKKQVKNKSLFVKTELPKEAKEKKKHTPKITLLFTPQKPAKKQPPPKKQAPLKIKVEQSQPQQQMPPMQRQMPQARPMPQPPMPVPLVLAWRQPCPEMCRCLSVLMVLCCCAGAIRGETWPRASWRPPTMSGCMQKTAPVRT